MKSLRLWLAAVLMLSCAACGSGKATAFSPSEAFVKRLQAKAEALAKSELERFNALEAPAKGELRFEDLKNPMMPDAAVFYKLYREYTKAHVADIIRSDSFVHPIAIRLVFNYKLMATPPRHTDFGDSLERAKADAEYTLAREDSVTLDYSCDIDGELAGSLPGLLPRDSLVNFDWNKTAVLGQAPESQLKPLPPPSELPVPKLPKSPQ
ncbi:MAG: hypothetical protein RBU21_05895 [FCB group bacterium]|jgi:hypothetical protein|nr:hypothetical protein [FCB group bacterium]